jgi:hypothetical protein
MLAFPIPRLTHTPSRSAVARRLHIGVTWERMYRLLVQLDPARAKRVKRYAEFDLGNNLLAAVDQLFPISIIDVTELEGLGELAYIGIPVTPMGFDDYTPHASLALIAVSLAQHIWASDRIESYPALANSPYIGHGWPGPLPTDEPIKWPKPPRGRAWKANWVAFPEAVEYVSSRTGWNWLDYNEEDEGLQLPEWNIGEIRSLAADWKKCKPILERITRFAQWVDADPTRHSLLYGALAGERNVLYAITEPRSSRTKTLAEVFTHA